jgi:hypothetical protein
VNWRRNVSDARLGPLTCKDDNCPKRGIFYPIEPKSALWRECRTDYCSVRLIKGQPRYVLSVSLVQRNAPIGQRGQPRDLLVEFADSVGQLVELGIHFVAELVEALPVLRRRRFENGLRKAGATAHELLAIYGWTKLAQAEIYTKNADRARLGEKAIFKINIAL